MTNIFSRRQLFPRQFSKAVGAAALTSFLWGAGLLSDVSPACAQEDAAPTAPTTPISANPAETLPSVTGIVGDIMRAEKANNAGDLVLAYGQAVRDPQLAKGALSALLYDFYRLRGLAGSAMQVSQAVDETSLRFAIFQAAQNQVNVQQNQQVLQQNQKIIDQNETLIKQNERMIALLDQIARKK